MRTTLSLDEDVAALLTRLRKARGDGLKALVNEALRRGLKEMSNGPQRPQTPVRTHAVSLGACKTGGIDNVAEALAVAESDSFR